MVAGYFQGGERAEEFVLDGVDCERGDFFDVLVGGDEWAREDESRSGEGEAGYVGPGQFLARL